MNRWKVIALGALAFIDACGQHDHGGGRATPSPAPLPIHGANRAMTTPPPVGVVPATVQTPRALPAAVPRLASDAAPQIVNLQLSKTVVSAGDTVVGTVVTSSNVASVELRVAAYGMTMRKTGVGRFAIVYTVPNVPFFLHNTYPLQIIARNTRGDAATREIPITVR